MHPPHAANNELATHGAIQIACALKTPGNAVSTLSLAANRIGNHGVAALCDAMRSRACRLRSLNVASNFLSEEAATTLAETLAPAPGSGSGPLLAHLDVSGNFLQVCAALPTLEL